MLRFLRTSLIILSALIASCSTEQRQEEAEEVAVDMVQFNSSDPELNAAWQWAKETALSYVRQGDPVGPWYEAALPNRNAFCMRDVSHQSTGAAVLGLNKENKNMLFRFAENISESKDYCSYWEINKDNVPAPVDYKNDKDFWYNLPANYDVVDACFRMYLWTGDTSYITDPTFLNFYRTSLIDYAERWELSASKILQRERLMNLPDGATPENHKYYDKRGIPGYYEGAGGEMQLGIDLLAVQYAANNWYHHYMSDDPRISMWLEEANRAQALIKNMFWDEEKQKFKLILYQDGSFDYALGDGADFSHALLHYKVLTDPNMINSVLDGYSNNKEGFIIEIASHLPHIFFKNGRPEDGVHMLKYLTDKDTPRREYPENPFSVVGAFVTGLMGVTAGAPDNFISTFSGMTVPYAQTMVKNLPVIGKKIDLLHRGRHTSMLQNHSDTPIFWAPYLEGIQEVWYINGNKESGYGKTVDHFGLKLTSFLIKVEPHTKASVSAYPPPEQ